MHRIRFSWLAAIAFTVALGACQGVSTPSASNGAAGTATTPATAAAPTTAIARYSCTDRDLTWDGASAFDLTGTWNGDDEGVYYLRQLGDQVWWLGMSGLGGPLAERGSDWTNVYFGTLTDDTVTGTYADVPQGGILDNGPVVMKVTRSSTGAVTLVRVDPLLATGFGGTKMTPCRLG
jgi:hypothetical protein